MHSGLESAAISSGNIMRSAGLTGLRDNPSATLCLTPEMWVILNRYLKVFSLRLRRRGLGMSSRLLSPKSFSRGLWSTAIMRFGQPSTKYLALSSA